MDEQRDLSEKKYLNESNKIHSSNQIELGCVNLGYGEESQSIDFNEEEDEIGPVQVDTDEENKTKQEEVGGNGITTPTPSNATTVSIKGLVSTKDINSLGPSVERETWDSPLEFLLSCIAMSVGLGNVWKFPFTAYENGGGAFLIPYFIVLLLIGRPIYYLEMCLGQFSRYGQVKVWGCSPFFKGVGYSSAVGAVCTMSFYCSIIALTIFYLCLSFQNPLPWSVCDASWGEDYCDSQNGTYIGPNNVSLSQLYYSKSVFPQLGNINSGIGYPLWRLSLCLLVAWVVIFFTLIKGVKSSGKAAYITAIFPYGVMFILLIRGLTLDGAIDGVLYFIKPRWESLLNPDVWFAAVSQCFFSLSTCFGTIIMLSSYNAFGHNVYRDAMIISFTDTFTSVLAGITIFSVLGSLAKSLDVDISVVAKAGPGLAFVSYPEAIAKLGYFPQVFAILFFLMLFALGVGSATSLAGGTITIICDQYPKIPRWQVTLPVCMFGFITGLLYITPGGQFMLTLVNRFGADFVIYIIGMIEVAAISWVYGLNNFCKDIQFMLGIKVGYYWKFCWGFCIPIGLFMILVYSFVKNTALVHEGAEYPLSAIRWMLSAIGLSFVPICAVHSVWSIRKEGISLKERIQLAFKPKESWGPQDPKLRQEWINFKLRKDT